MRQCARTSAPPSSVALRRTASTLPVHTLTRKDEREIPRMGEPPCWTRSNLRCCAGTGSRSLTSARASQPDAQPRDPRRPRACASPPSRPTIARRIGFSRREIDTVVEGALLHDLGKTRVPREILDQRRPLTADEYATVKKHPDWGAALVDGHVAGRALRAIRHHHEWWNGGGYPARLAGVRHPGRGAHRRHRRRVRRDARGAPVPPGEVAAVGRRRAPAERGHAVRPRARRSADREHRRGGPAAAPRRYRTERYPLQEPRIRPARGVNRTCAGDGPLRTTAAGSSSAHLLHRQRAEKDFMAAGQTEGDCRQSTAGRAAMSLSSAFPAERGNRERRAHPFEGLLPDGASRCGHAAKRMGALHRGDCVFVAPAEPGAPREVRGLAGR